MADGVIIHEPVTPRAATLHAHGEFDRDNCDRFATAVYVELAAGRRVIDMNMRHLDFIDAACVATLLDCRARAFAVGAELRIGEAAGIVAQILDITAVPRLHGPSGGAHRWTRRSVPRDPLSAAAEVVATSGYLVERARVLVAQTRRLLTAIHS
ncbi:STAS domain-containing protein [Paractinoplanes atraurantiacus]|uniref:Anti-anti-sigma factor n=1 Tax=Paractinoplanes atraurantiacus TaxID=1036182 RepID=A0A285JLP1_9ACTN|nr:STAS domain-containing protein [Actinoplanes atraurantiacus]SNY61178.1 anti-anti-sigma factor [Actinoplanes atraurantiacus]